MPVIDIKRRLVDKAKKELAEKEGWTEQDLQNNYSQLQKITDTAETVESIQDLMRQVNELVGEGLMKIRLDLQLSDKKDSESLANLYLSGMVFSGNLFSCSEAVKLLMQRLEELEPDIKNEHFLKILSKLRDKYEA